MLFDLNELLGYDIAAEDGALGSVHDFYFDDRYWTVRYLVVDTGNWLPGRKVLIAPPVLREIDHERGCLAVALTKQQIKDSPGSETDLPVSRQHEIELHDYYQWPYYWAAFPAGSAAAIPPPAVSDAGSAASTDPILRSAREVIGYYIAARDDDIGHIETLIGDDQRWLIPYFVVDTRNWLPGRKVLVASAWINHVSWTERQVHVDLTRDAIRQSPAYDASRPLSRDDEERLHRHYERRGYWHDSDAS